MWAIKNLFIEKLAVIFDTGDGDGARQLFNTICAGKKKGAQRCECLNRALLAAWWWSKIFFLHIPSSESKKRLKIKDQATVWENAPAIVWPSGQSLQVKFSVTLRSEEDERMRGGLFFTGLGSGPDSRDTHTYTCCLTRPSWHIPAHT